MPKIDPATLALAKERVLISDWARPLGVRLRGQRILRGGCPKCATNAKDQTLSISDSQGWFKCHRASCEIQGDAISWLIHVEGFTPSDAFPELIRRAGMSLEDATLIPDPDLARRLQAERDATRAAHDQEAAERQKRVRKFMASLWQAANPVWTQAHDRLADPARIYWESRGLSIAGIEWAVRYGLLNLDDIRSAASLDYRDGEETYGRFPGLIARMTDRTGAGLALHRTFLRGDFGAKADVPTPKKVLGPAKGSVIWMAPKAPERLCVAEGVETALAALLASIQARENIPVAAAYSLGNMGQIPLPTSVKEVILIIDNDGKTEESRARVMAMAEDSGRALAKANPNVQALSKVVPPVGMDLNDWWASQVSNKTGRAA